MSNQIAVSSQTKAQLTRSDWAKLGLITAVASIVAVLAVQALAISIWSELALFAPLDNYVRSTIFTLVPAIGATVLLAWLVGHRARPVQDFVIISVVVLIVSIIPDYILPVPYKTLLASSVTAFLHVVAAVVTVSLLVLGYQRRRARHRQI